MPVLDHTKILFIHIPRNGGICMPWRALNEDGNDEENPLIHAVRDDIKIDLNKEGTEFTFTKSRSYGNFETLLQMKSRLDVSQYTPVSIVRNPFTRTFSLYVKYLLISDLFKEDKSFLNFLQQIKSNGTFNPKARGLVPKTQTSWVCNELNQLDPTVRIYKLENLEEFKNDLNVDILYRSHRFRYDDPSEFTLLNPEIPKEDPNYHKRMQGRNLKKKHYVYSQEEMIYNYTSDCKNLVLDIFAEDFANFGYSTNFEDALT